MQIEPQQEYYTNKKKYSSNIFEHLILYNQLPKDDAVLVDKKAILGRTTCFIAIKRDDIISCCCGVEKILNNITMTS